MRSYETEVYLNDNQNGTNYTTFNSTQIDSIFTQNMYTNDTVLVQSFRYDTVNHFFSSNNNSNNTNGTIWNATDYQITVYLHNAPYNNQTSGSQVVVTNNGTWQKTYDWTVVLKADNYVNSNSTSVIINDPIWNANQSLLQTVVTVDINKSLPNYNYSSLNGFLREFDVEEIIRSVSNTIY